MQLLDVDDMIQSGSNPDWKCVFTYVNSIYAELSAKKKKNKNTDADNDDDEDEGEAGADEDDEKMTTENGNKGPADDGEGKTSSLTAED